MPFRKLTEYQPLYAGQNNSEALSSQNEGQVKRSNNTYSELTLCNVQLGLPSLDGRIRIHQQEQDK